MSDPTVEIESPPVRVPEAQMPTVRRQDIVPLLERMLVEGADEPLERIQKLTKALETLRRAAIQATYPADWIIHVSKDKEGNLIRQVGYLQDCGAERAGKIWGIQVSRPIIEREDFADGTYAYNLLADAYSKVTGEQVENVEGSRWSGDPFFDRGSDKIDPTDVRKSAWANLHGRAVRQLGGLNAVPLDQLEAAGVDPKKVVHIGYSSGAKGGTSTGAQIGGSDLVLGWGKGKDKTVAEQTDKDLQFYIQAAERDLADPAKNKFHRKTQVLLEALKAEQDKRSKSAEQATADKAPADAKGKTLPDRRTAFYRRLTKICTSGDSVVNANRMLDVLTQGGATTVSELDAAQLADLEAMSDEQIISTRDSLQPD